MKGKLGEAWELVLQMVKMFFGNKEKVDHCKKTGLLAACYRSGQYFLILLTGVFVGVLQKYLGKIFVDYFGSLYLGIFVILFAMNLLIMSAVVYANGKTTHDFTFMEGLRKILKTGYGLWFVFGLFLESLAFFILLVWSGADQFVIYFEDRITSLASKITILVLASCASMAIWTHAYLGVANGFFDLIRILYDGGS